MRRFLFVAALLLMLPACADPMSAPDGPFLHADVEGAVSLAHRGAANWGGGTMSPEHRKRVIASYDGDSRITLKVLRDSVERYEVTTYPLTPRHFESGHNDGNTAIHRIGSVWYIAESGAFTITDISPEWMVSGHFDFTAVFWCDRAIDRDSCLILPDEFPADLPRIRVRGRFAAEKVGDVPRIPGGP